MPRNTTSSFPTGLLMLALAGAATLLGYLLLAPATPEPADDILDNASAGGGSLEFEFYDRLQQDDVEINSRPREPAEPGATEIGRLIEQLTPAEPSPAQEQLEIAGNALEEIAQTIVSGIETRSPEPVSAPEPAPPVPLEPSPPAETVLAAPEPVPEPVPESSPEPAVASASSPVQANPREAAADPEPQPQPQAARASGTLLQSGAFRQQALAQSELERQRSLGLAVEIARRPDQEGALFLIQSGPYEASDKLEEAELVFQLHNIDTMRRSAP